jgi:SAM-dependent methyltransferase
MLYDTFDGDRADLPAYLRIARELAARTLLDVGCGTGSFTLLAAASGIRATGVDPAQASLDVARAKSGAENVTWHCGEVLTAPQIRVDLAVMTGNVAQVFPTDDDWLRTLRATHDRLTPGGHLVYETRRCDDRAWERWAEDTDEAMFTFTGIGPVRRRRQMLSIDLPWVSFRYTYSFPDGSQIPSDSTLRFRSDDENRQLLVEAGFRVDSMRDAPDRPGREHVYIACAAGVPE